MSLVSIQIDDDVREMGFRIAGRIGKGLSETLQDGLIYIARAHGWAVDMEKDESLDEGKREEVYVLWSTLEPAQRAHILNLMEHPKLHATVQALEDRITSLSRKAAHLDGEIGRLATFITENIPGEPSADEGAVDTAIRLITSSRSSLKHSTWLGYSADEWVFEFSNNDDENGLTCPPPDNRPGWFMHAPFGVPHAERDGVVIPGAFWRRRKGDAQGSDESE